LHLVNGDVALLGSKFEAQGRTSHRRPIEDRGRFGDTDATELVRDSRGDGTMRRLALMAALMATCFATTGCFRDTFRNCSLFRGDECGGGQPARGGLCDWNWFGTRDRYQPVVSGYGACDTCVGCVGCEGGYTAYSPGMEVMDGGVYYEGMDGSFSDSSFSGGSIISEGEIIGGSQGGTIVLPGPAN
jgi:hypothetical protein